MKHILRRALAAGLCGLMAGLAPAAENPAWLLGTWQLHEDQKRPGFTDDFMDFHADGSVTLRDSKGVFATCPYTPSVTRLMLVCTVRGQEKAVVYRISDDHKTLVNPLGDVYRRKAR
ncbi:hypothetical protein [Variovorax terrae]|uniref:Lipoprotein n=1 Tax=Variovorax terrae TaxID=2923278 RepID=A0A9X2AQ46_9BURK|nr:hypothetical protein [Variovorax terrae]MCJ0765590.1 hypothetical protein [Variovorax terrae]